MFKPEDLLAQIQNTNNRLWSFDTELKVTVVNKKMQDDYYKAFGIRLEKGSHILENVPEPILSNWKKYYAQALKGESFSIIEKFEIEGVPEYSEIAFNPIIKNGIVIGVACSAKDLSVQKKAELALQKSEANLFAQFENTNDSIWSVDNEYKILTINNTFVESFNQAFNHRLKKGDEVLNYFPEPLRSMWKERYDRALKGEQFKVIDKYDFEDLPQYVEIVYNPIRVDDQIVGVACFTRDITQLKLSENALQEALSAKDKFFSIIAHDLKGPVSNIIELIRMLSDEKFSLSESDRSETLSHLGKAANNVYYLLNNLLNWAISQQKEVEINKDKIYLKEFVNNTIAPYMLNAQIKNIVVENKINDKQFVMADPGTLSLIIANLFNNAAKFTNEHGKISLALKNNNGYDTISISDTGIGMSEELIEKILSAHEIKSTPGTHREIGTGLGLLISHEFIKKHEGHLDIKSTPRKGSTFSFRLPH